ncbi:MAG: DUF3228 family protein, partial [bacterium]
MKIGLIEFARRHWRGDFTGTRVIGLSPDELIALCNQAMEAGTVLVDGYAPFCKHLFLVNLSATRCGFAPITEENIHLLKSGYVARRESELPVLERWFEGLTAPKAMYL